MKYNRWNELVYWSAGNRCAVCLENLNLPISNEQAIEILRKKGFQVINVDIISLARSCVGKSKYRRVARFSEAPEVFDCSTFTKWLYAQLGIWLPRRTIQQREIGEPIDISELKKGDLVFKQGFKDYFYNNPDEGVGHVGIITEEETVIHAANKKAGVIEVSFDIFLKKKDKFRGARRIIPNNKEIITFLTPPEREIEISDDMRWVILQEFPNQV